MPFFSYKAIDQNGEIVKGVVEDVNIDFAYNNITSAGLSVISIRKTNGYIVSIKKKLLARGIKRKDIIEFASNLSTMLRAGIPLLAALYDIENTAQNSYFRKKIAAIRKMVEGGARFSEAIYAHKDIFPDILVRLVVVGEETGTLDRSLSDVAGHLQRMEDLASSTKRALIYPVFAVVVTLGALIFWLAYVLPMVVAVLKDMQIALPLPTQMLIAVSEFVQSYWYLLLLSPATVFVLIKILRQWEKTRYYTDAVKISFPIMKHFTYTRLLALLAEQLRILTVAGITINRSFEIVASVVGNDVFKVAIEDSIQRISSGSSISDAMRKHKIFPEMMLRMVHIGETSGTLDRQLEYLSEFYLKRLDDVSQKLGKMLEPIVIVIIGAMFLMIVIGLLFPVYELVTKIGK